jgi:virulence-associated protein VagC
MNQGKVGVKRRDWLVENDDARKALHALYFETGSLPNQQPKLKLKEPEKANPAEQAGQIAPLPDVASDVSANNSNAKPSGNSWVKPAIFFTIALCVGFGVYRVMPRLDTSSKPAAHHIKSPLIREALEKQQAAEPTAQPGASLEAMGSLAVTPSVIMAQYSPGQSSTQTLTVDNQTPEAMTFAMEAVDVVAKGDQLVFVPAGDTPNSVAATAVFSEKFVRVELMDKATVQVTLTWPAATNVRGVVARLRSTDEAHLGGIGLMATSLGTLITFSGGQNSAAGAAGSQAGVQSSDARPLAISQWSEQNGTSTPGMDNAGTSSNSKAIKVPNLASLGGNQ